MPLPLRASRLNEPAEEERERERPNSKRGGGGKEHVNSGRSDQSSGRRNRPVFDVNLSEIKLLEQNSLLSPQNVEVLQKMVSPLFARGRRGDEELKEIEERLTSRREQQQAAGEGSSVSGSASAPGTARSARTAVPSARVFTRESARQHTSASARTVKRSESKKSPREARSSAKPEKPRRVLSMRSAESLIRQNIQAEI